MPESGGVGKRADALLRRIRRTHRSLTLHAHITSGSSWRSTHQATALPVLQRRQGLDTPKQEDFVSQFVMPRRNSAGVLVIVATATVPLTEPSQPRRIVAVGRISRHGGRVVISARLAGLNTAPARVGR